MSGHRRRGIESWPWSRIGVDGIWSSCREFLEVLHPDWREDFLIGTIVFTMMAIIDAAFERRLLPSINLAHCLG